MINDKSKYVVDFSDGSSKVVLGVFLKNILREGGSGIISFYEYDGE